MLLLDGAPHSYVDLDDPTYLRFDYARAVVAAIDDIVPRRASRCGAYHLGGGGLTVPRYLDATRPGTTSLVSEIDPGVVAVDSERLGFAPGDVDRGAGRGRPARGAAAAVGSRDLVVGDAFGGVSVPWHLTTGRGGNRHQSGADRRRRLRRQPHRPPAARRSLARRWSRCRPHSPTWPLPPNPRRWPGRVAATWL